MPKKKKNLKQGKEVEPWPELRNDTAIPPFWALGAVAPPKPCPTAAEPVTGWVFFSSGPCSRLVAKHRPDRAGEYQQLFEKYWHGCPLIAMPGGHCGASIAMIEWRMRFGSWEWAKLTLPLRCKAILLNPHFDFSEAYYVLFPGVCWTPPSRGNTSRRKLGNLAGRYDLASLGTTRKRYCRRAGFHSPQGI